MASAELAPIRLTMCILYQRLCWRTSALRHRCLRELDRLGEDLAILIRGIAVGNLDNVTRKEFKRIAACAQKSRPQLPRISSRASIINSR
jgi:hypothetical protein